MMAPHTALTMRASIAARPTATTTTTKTTGAASKAKKNRDLDRLRDLASAEETLLVAGFNYQGLTVKDMIAFRRAMPEGATIMVAKNTLLRKAVEGTSFAPISDCSTGMNAWVFVDENVAPTMKAVKKLTKDWNKEGKEVSFTGACMDGQFIAPDAMKPLEDLPTKLDLITRIAA